MHCVFKKKQKKKNIFPFARNHEIKKWVQEIKNEVKNDTNLRVVFSTTSNQVNCVARRPAIVEGN
jgi:hypothetical protein